MSWHVGERPTSFTPTLNKYLPLLFERLRTDPVSIVRETISWTLQAIATAHAEYITHTHTLLHHFLLSMHDSLSLSTPFYIRKNACNALSSIFRMGENYKDKAISFISPFFLLFFDALLDILFETETDPTLTQLRIN